ncbi:unnamed protein product [Brachionus calyciflorus]|uniref:Chitinase n=1 Tax=Brachionus calyciflorus TaxID=104777 RepID=A0A813NXP3_9BILA|nr:unnamed protein product [Brachionus calyciflorus]
MKYTRKTKWLKIYFFLALILPCVVLGKTEKKFCRDPNNCQFYLSCSNEDDPIKECSNSYVFDEDLQKCVRAVSVEDFQCLILAAYLSEEINSNKKDKKKFSSLVESKKKQKEDEPEFEVEDVADDGKTYKRMCVVTNWSQFRPGRGRFSFDFIDAKLCNHIIYASVKVAESDSDDFDSEEYEIQAVQHNEAELYAKLRVIKAKNPSVKLILRITDESGRSYSKLSKSFDTRLSFVRNALEYIEDNSFDGIEIEWRWPAGPSGSLADKENLILLLKDLRFKFGKKYIIGMIMSPLTERIQLYNLLELNKYVDYVNVETFDYYGPWDKKTGLMSPLGKMDEQYLFEAYMNIEGTIGYLKSLGLLSEKIVLGLAAYSRSYTLQHPMANRVNDLIVGNGFSGSFTKTNGMLANYELCDLRKKGNWKEKWHPLAQVPFMFDETQWVSFENEESLAKKIDFVKTNELAGACVYSIDLDDFRGLFCNKSRYPFLKMSLGLLATSNRFTKTSLIDELQETTSQPMTSEIEISTTKQTQFSTNSKFFKKLTTKSTAFSSNTQTRKNLENSKKIENVKNKAGAKFSYVLITPPPRQKNSSINRKPDSEKTRIHSRPRNLEVPIKLSKPLRKIELDDDKEKSEKIDETITIKPKVDKIESKKIYPSISILKSFSNEPEETIKELPVPEKLISNDEIEMPRKSQNQFVQNLIQPLQNSVILNQIKINPANKCVGKKNGIYREEEDCAAFYVCESLSEIKIHKFKCPDGLAFNMRDCTCDWPREGAICVVPLHQNLCKETQSNGVTENKHFTTVFITTYSHITKPVVQESTQKIPIETTHQPLSLSQFPQQTLSQFQTNNNVNIYSQGFTCTNKQQGTYPDPYDCTKFYYCQPMPNEPKALTHEFRCPQGLHFNLNICRCDWPNKSCIVPNHISYPCW